MCLESQIAEGWFCTDLPIVCGHHPILGIAINSSKLNMILKQVPSLGAIDFFMLSATL